MLFVGFQYGSSSFWFLIGGIFSLVVAFFLFMGAANSHIRRAYLAMACIFVALICIFVAAILDPGPLAAAKIKSAHGPEYKVGICIKTNANVNANESELTLHVRTEGTAAPDQLRLTRVGTGHCGVAGPFLSGKVTTVVVSPPDPPATWVIREFTFRYLTQGEPGVRTPRIQSMPVELSPDGKYRFRVIAADLTDNVPTADIAPVEGDASLLQPPATQ